jgi:3-dehydroquinate synthase
VAEAIKHGVIADAAYFAQTTDALPSLVDQPRGDAMLSLIVRSIEIKAEVVRRDEREGGLRKILNFGHTLGHAIETESGYRLLHGEAIAIGMVLEGRLAERIGVASPGTAGRIEKAVQRAGLPTSRPPTLEPERLLAATRGDKKARAGAAEYALPRTIGEMAGEESGWALRVADDQVRSILTA